MAAALRASRRLPMAAIPSTSTAVAACPLTDAQQALLARLHAYSPDDPDAPLPYSRRLA
ncbi:TIGR04222 domain-containing membrane protein, partial [Burkholderia cenocepacia]|nr:TIGR04222 domain-containing membrane protein [Burkholderia cenocepacia]